MNDTGMIQRRAVVLGGYGRIRSACMSAPVHKARGATAMPGLPFPPPPILPEARVRTVHLDDHANAVTSCAPGMAALSLVCLAGGLIFAPDLWGDPPGPLVKILPGIALALMVWLTMDEG